MTHELGPARSRLCGSRVLVVEDDAAMRETLARCLRREGASVSEAEDGLQGLESLMAGAFDLVISDVHMPKMNGLDFLREVKKIYRTPILLMTGEPKSVAEVSELEEQAIGLIRKPMALGDFVETVSGHLKTSDGSGMDERLWLNIICSSWFIGLGVYLHFVGGVRSGAYMAILIIGPVLLRLGFIWVFSG